MPENTLEVFQKMKWNSGLPPVDLEVLVALDDGTIWRVHRKHWVQTYKSDPCYRCVITDHPLPIKQVLGWRYP